MLFIDGNANFCYVKFHSFKCFCDVFFRLDNVIYDFFFQTFQVDDLLLSLDLRSLHDSLEAAREFLAVFQLYGHNFIGFCDGINAFIDFFHLFMDGLKHDLLALLQTGE